MTVTIAAIQMCSGTDPVRNAETMRRLVREAAAKGAVYVQTPEMTGALQRDRAGLRAILRQEADDLVVAAAAELAGELGIHVHVGSTAIALADGKVANRGFLFGRRVGLVDDVYTTGATVAAVTRILKRAGVTDVTVLTFARALPGPI